MMYGWDMTGWGWVWMVTVMTTGILLVALLAVALVRSDSRGTQGIGQEDPENVLALRLARGEIDEEEYQRRKTILRPDLGSSGR